MMGRCGFLVFAVAVDHVAVIRGVLVGRDEEDYYEVSLGQDNETHYKEPESYRKKSAAEKLAELWTLITLDPVKGEFMTPMQTLATVTGTDSEVGIRHMSDIHSDWRDVNHNKCTHGSGAHAKMHFEWDDNKYTGMFKTADHCVVRLANAVGPSKGFGGSTFGPNAAVKCLNDGRESANLQLIWQLDGYLMLPGNKTNPGKVKGSCSYFEAPLANHNRLRADMQSLFNPLYSIFALKFAKIDDHAMLIGVSQMAQYKQDGTEVPKPIFPFALVFKPAAGLNELPCNFTEPNSQLLHDSLKKGTELYEIYAVHDASEQLTKSSLVRIGKMVLDSPFTESNFGDHRLFFRHTFFKDEVQLLAKTDPGRADQWTKFVKNKTNYENEGPDRYWPFLGGPKEEMLTTEGPADSWYNWRL